MDNAKVDRERIGKSMRDAMHGVRSMRSSTRDSKSVETRKSFMINRANNLYILLYILLGI